MDYLNNNELPYRIIMDNDKDKKVLLSCPHTVKHFREGKFKYPESMCGVIIELLINKFKNSEVLGIYKIGDVYDDPNHSNTSLYKQKVLELVKEEEIDYFIDLHIMGRHRSHDIELGTSDNENINYDFSFLEKIKESVTNNDLILEVDNLFKASNPEVLSKYIKVNSHESLKCIQIEMNYRLMEEEESFKKLLKMLTAVIDVCLNS